MTHRLNTDATATDSTGASPLPPDDRVNTAVNAFRMLADPTRVRILYALARQDTRSTISRR